MSDTSKAERRLDQKRERANQYEFTFQAELRHFFGYPVRNGAKGIFNFFINQRAKIWAFDTARLECRGVSLQLDFAQSLQADYRRNS